MSFDITPPTPPGRQLVQAYGDGGFRISGAAYEGNVLVFLDKTIPWGGDLTLNGLRHVLDEPKRPEILIVGCGDAFFLPPDELRQALKTHGVILEWMDTPAACRTYNVLALEDRCVAAAMSAV